MKIEQARKLVEKARKGLVTAEQAIIQIIHEQAWEPLGYQNFAELWAAEFQGRVGIIADSIRPQLIVSLVESGLDTVGISVALAGSGVGPATVETVVRQHGHGVPVDAISTTLVRTHVRSKPSAPRFVKVEVSCEQYARWNDLAVSNGSTLAKEAEVALVEHFGRLAHPAA